MNASPDWRDVPVPPRLAKRPTDHRGYPITFVSAVRPDGTHDFTLLDPEKLGDCIRFHWCGLCGQPLGRYRAFLGGPKSAEFGTYADPPMHEECARYATQVCPFLAINTARYRKVRDDEISRPFSVADRPDEFIMLVATRVTVKTDPMGTPVFVVDLDSVTDRVVVSSAATAP